MPDPKDDPGFDGADTRLNEDLAKIERERTGSKGGEFGHDQTYTPGYHEGGSRFGFFNEGDPSPAPTADKKTPADKA